MNPKRFSREWLHATTPARLELVTITADSGVGSSSALTSIRSCYPWPYKYLSGGSIMREWAAKAGMPIEEYTAHIGKHPEMEVDIKLDARLTRECERPCTIIESRLAHMLGKHGFHVLLTCPYETRAPRRASDLLDKKPPGMPFMEYVDKIQQKLELRDQEDWARFESLYPDCRWCPDTDFDLVISTAQFRPPQIAEQILEAHLRWQAQIMAL